MADPMLGLLDTDSTSFLDKRTGSEQIGLTGQRPSMPVPIPGPNGGMMQPQRSAVQMMSSPAGTFINPLQDHHAHSSNDKQSNFSPMASSPNLYGSMSQDSVLPQQYGNASFSQQYGGGPAEFHHINISVLPGGLPSLMVGHSPTTHAEKPYTSPPHAAARMVQREPPSLSTYHSYGMHASPRISPLAHVRTLQTDAAYTYNVENSSKTFVQQQQQNMPPKIMTGVQMPQNSNYMASHGFTLMNSNQVSSHLDHFPDRSNEPSVSMGSIMQDTRPQPRTMTSRLSHIHMPSSNSGTSLHQGSTDPSARQHSFSQTQQSNVNMANFTSQSQTFHCSLPIEIPVASTNPASLGQQQQHFPFHTSSKQNVMTSQGLNEALLRHYPNHCPNPDSKLSQYLNTYPSVTSHSKLSTAHSSPATPSNSTTDLLILPRGNQHLSGSNQSTVNSFLAPVPSSQSPNLGMGISQRPPSSVAYTTTDFCPKGVTMSINSDVNTTNSIGVARINPHLQQDGFVQDGGTVAEINQLQQHVKQLYEMPQTPHTQQRMLDLQERMCTLKAQQQQQIMQRTRKRQQVFMHQQAISMSEDKGIMSQPITSPLSRQPVDSIASPQKEDFKNLTQKTNTLESPVTTLTSPSPHHQQTSCSPHVGGTPCDFNSAPRPIMIASQVPTSQQPLPRVLQQSQSTGHTMVTDQHLMLSADRSSGSLSGLAELSAQVQVDQLVQPQQLRSWTPQTNVLGNEPVLPKPKSLLITDMTLCSPPAESVLQLRVSPSHTSPIGNCKVPMQMQDVPGLPFHPQLQAHQQSPHEAEEFLNSKLELPVSEQSGNAMCDPVNEGIGVDFTPEKKKKKKSRKSIQEGSGCTKKSLKKKVPKSPCKKKAKDLDKATKIVAEAVAQTEAAVISDVAQIVVALCIPTTVQDVSGDLNKSDLINVTDVQDANNQKKKLKKESVPKPKKLKTPKARPSKKKPPATFLNKRKRGGSPDASDLETTPPPSPQDQEDNSIQKRRSARNTGTKRKKYLDELELNLSEEENTVHGVGGDQAGDGALAMIKNAQFFQENPNEEDAVVVQKILGMRMRRRDKDEEDGLVEQAVEDEEEFYVKYKNFSYLHCEWRTVKELEKDKRIPMKIKRYKMKRLAHNTYFSEVDEEELFNPDYVEVDRVLDVSVTTEPNTQDEITHFLVKWRSLPYEESTWELLQDVDPNKVQIFYRFLELPSEEDRQFKERPSKVEEWKQFAVSLVYKNDNTLREYQLEGLNWLNFCWYNRRNSILADEMGLGKTIQSLTFSHKMFLYGIRGPFLVVAPLSTIANWQREYETWTDMNVITYHGSTPSRVMIQEYEMFFKDENGQRIADVYKFNVMITTYEIIIADYDVLSQIDWRLAIIDEAHRLKNRNCQLLERLKLFQLEHRVLLTGTPLQNNVEELFTLLNFLEPQTFNSSEAFMTEFGTLKTEGQVEKLKAILKPMMLRRLKEDVEKNLAPKEETIVEVELTNIQKKYYRAILERNFTFLAKGAGSSANVPNLMNTMMELRKCCNHPYLIKGAEDKILEEVREKHGNDAEHIFSALVQSCGKLVLIDKLLPKLKQDGHKVLIFSQMIRVLDILEDYCVQRRYLYERLDGRIRGNIRQEAIDRFSKTDSDRFVFLLCTRAGGLGINLTAADTVIIFDSDWNPQNDLQAQARCHRIGQSRLVKVYRLITRNTYEREMFDKASLKLGLDKAVLQSMTGDKQATQQSGLSKGEVEELLRKGAYGALMEDDNAGNEFCEEDIDQILQRRTQVVQIETEGKGSTFAKASFSASGNRSDISIDDPNFWQLWAKKADIDTEKLNDRNNLIIVEPRQRRQTTRYGNQDNMLDNMSELESSSDSEGEATSGRRGRRAKKRPKGDPNDEDYEGPQDNCNGRYTRAECFRVEKNLLVYGWGRWSDILAHSRFKRKLDEKDVESISRALLAYSLHFYKGDERIKRFISDLLSPDKDLALKNHPGLSAPIPRGRKGQKIKNETKYFCPSPDMDKCNFELDFEDILTDTGYKKHLQRHSNKVLLRVRLLYYLKQEVIGDEEDKVFMGYPSCDLDIPSPCCDGDRPAAWWDEEADRSLLVGIFKHGYGKYNLMRQDPALVFLSRCGPPDGAAVLAEQSEDENDDFPDEKLGTVSHLGDDDDEEDESSLNADCMTPRKPTPSNYIHEQCAAEFGKVFFPSVSDLNTRLRRVVAGYQRSHKKEQQRMAQRTKRMERKTKTELVTQEREIKKMVSQQRWSRREEADFYRTVSTFGVEIHSGEYRWERFRIIARLEKKRDDTLTDYFLAFYHMCRTVCKRFRQDEDPAPPNNIYVEPITEERASRCLNRINLLTKIRQEILTHEKLEERLKLCLPSFDMPDWWKCGDHDKDLMIGAARHGLARTDYHILHDPMLSFQKVIQHKSSEIYASSARNLRSKSEANTLTGMEGFEECRPHVSENISGELELLDTAYWNRRVKRDSLSDHEEVEAELLKTNVDNSTSDILNELSKKTEEEEREVFEEGTALKLEESIERKILERDEQEESRELMTGVDEEDTDSGEDKTRPEAKVTKAGQSPQAGLDEDIREAKFPLLLISNDENRHPDILMSSQRLDQSCESEAHSQESTGQLLKSDLHGAMMNDINKEMTVAEILSRSIYNPALQWPKDKVVFHRLEHICYTIENGEWPSVRRSYMLPNGDSRSTTPTGINTPKSESLQGDNCSSDVPSESTPVEGVKVKMFKVYGETEEEDEEEGEVLLQPGFNVHVSENDGLKMTFQKRRRRRKLELEEERARLQQLMNQSVVSSDGESPVEIGQTFPSTPSRGQSSQDRLVNGISDHRLEDSSLMAQALAHAQAVHAHALAQAQAHALGEPMKKRRGRKRKVDKLAEQEVVAAGIRMEREQENRRFATAVAQTPETHVTVINVKDGSRLSGMEAPSRKDLDKWLDDHPGYIVERPNMDEEYLQLHMEEALGRRRGRKPRLDPSKLNPASLTGDENVSVINRETGKKITGAKAPPLKYLAEWLHQNQSFDVDPKWAELVQAKGNLPGMESRVLLPSDRRRRHKNMDFSTGMLGDFPFPIMSTMGGVSAASLASAGLIANFPKLPINLPFGALPNLSMTNPILGLGGFGIPGIHVPLSTAANMAEATISKNKRSKDHRSSEKEAKLSPTKSNTPIPHPSFPLMCNPLLYNPLFAAQGMRNFILPPNLPTSFASLGQTCTTNAMPEDEEADVNSDAQNVAQDLSVGTHKKTVREKLEELRAHQKLNEKGGKDRKSGKKQTHSVDTIHDVTLKRECRSSDFSEKPEDLSVKPKLIKPNRIIDRSKVESLDFGKSKLERCVAKLKALEKARSSNAVVIGGTNHSLSTVENTCLLPDSNQDTESGTDDTQGQISLTDKTYIEAEDSAEVCDTNVKPELHELNSQQALSESAVE